MPHGVLGWVKHITSRERSVKGLVSGNRHNNDTVNDGNTEVLVDKNEQDDDNKAVHIESTDGLEIEEPEECEIEQYN